MCYFLDLDYFFYKKVIMVVIFIDIFNYLRLFNLKYNIYI